MEKRITENKASEKKEIKGRKTYERPQIIYQQPFEVVAATCDITELDACGTPE